MRAALLVVVASVASCSLLDTSDLSGGPAVANPVDDSGAMPDAAVDAPPCGVLYVSPAGSDAADGCAPTAAVATLSKAIELAKSRRLAGGEIRVCRGTYRETIRLDHPVSVVGSFDCASWQREAVEPPTWLATTVIQPSEGDATFTVSGPVGLDTRVEGLQIEGPTAGEAGIALLIDGASPTIARSKVVGGRTTTTSAEAASFGAYVRSGAGPKIQDCLFNGGGGVASGTAAASIALKLKDAGEVSILGSWIQGGFGSAQDAGFSSVGLSIKGTRPVLVQGNTIRGGHGTSTYGGGVGVFVQKDATVTLVGNMLSGGAATSTRAGVANVAVYFAGTGLVDRNRILGSEPPGPPPSESRGILVADSSRGLVITNNAIHGGSATSPATLQTSTAILLAGAVETSVRHNSIFAGRAASGQATGVAIAEGTSGFVLSNNVIFGHNGSSGIVLFDCNGTMPSVVQGNAFFSLASVGRRISQATAAAPCATVTGLPTLDDFDAMLTARYPSATVGSNIELRPTCGASGTCRATASCSAPGAACIGAVLASWDEATLGDATIRGDGFALASGAPCALAKPASAGPAAVTSDLLGAPRSPPFSLGANEMDGACTP